MWQQEVMDALQPPAAGAAGLKRERDPSSGDVDAVAGAPPRRKARATFVPPPAEDVIDMTQDED